MGLKKICENVVISMFSNGVDSAFMIGGAALVLYGGIKLCQVAKEMKEVDKADDIEYVKPKAMKIEISDNLETEDGEDVEIDISEDAASNNESVIESAKKMDWSKRIQKYVRKMLQGVIMIQTSNLITLGFTKVLGDRFNEQCDVISKITTMLNRFRGRSSLLNTLSTVADERSRGVLLGESKGIDAVVSSISRIMTKG